MANYNLSAEYAVGPGLYGYRSTADATSIQYRQWKYQESGEWFDSYDFLAPLSPSYSFLPNNVALVYSKALGVSSVTFNLSGVGTGLIRKAILPTTARSFAVTPDPATLLKGFKLGATTSAYALSGKANTFLRGYVVTGVKAAYTVTTYATGLLKGFKLPAVQQTYTFTGKAAPLLRGCVIGVALGTYSLSGKASGLFKGYVVVGAARSYSVTGNASTGVHAYVLAPAKGTFTLSGVASSLKKGFALGATARAFSITGSNTVLAYSRIMPVSVRTYAINGITTKLTKGFTLVTTKGTFSETGGSDTFDYYHLNVTKGTFSLAGVGAGTFRGYDLNTTSGSFNLNAGGSIGFNHNYAIHADYLQSVGLFGAPATANVTDIQYQQWQYLEDGEWFDSYDHGALSPSYAVESSSVVMKQGKGLPTVVGTFAATSYPITYVYRRVFPVVSRTYALSGVAQSLKKGFVLGTNVASYSLLGKVTPVLKGFAVPTTKGTFALTGRATTLLKGFALPTTSSAYAFGWSAIKLLKGFYLGNSSATFIFTGRANSFLRTYDVIGVRASYALTSNLATLLHTAIMSAVKATYSLSGVVVILKKGFYLGAASRSISLTGRSSILAYSRIMPVTSRSYTLNGSLAGLLKGSKVVVSSSSFSLVGNSDSYDYYHFVASTTPFSYTVSPGDVLRGYALNVSKGTFLENAGGSISYTHQYDLRADYLQNTGLYGAPSTSGSTDTQYQQWLYLETGEWFDTYDHSALSPSYIVSTGAVVLRQAKALGAGSTSFNLSTSPVTILHTALMPAVTRTYTFTGKPNQLLHGFLLTGAIRSYVTTGNNNVFLRTYVAKPTVGTYSFTGRSLTLLHGSVLPANQASYVVTTPASTLKKGFYLGTTTRSFALTSSAASTFATRYLPSTVRTYSISGTTTGLVRALRIPTLTRSFAVASSSVTMDYYHMNTTTVGFIYTSLVSVLTKGFVVPTGSRSYALVGTGAITSSRTYDLTADYAESAGLYGEPATADPRATLYRQWLFMEDGEWYDSYSFGAKNPSYVVGTSSAAIFKTWAIATTKASFVFTGVPTNLQRAAVLSAVSRSYVVTPNSVSLTKGFVNLGTRQTYAVVPTTSSLFATRRFSTVKGIFSLAGSSAGVFKGFRVVAAPQQYILGTTVTNLYKQFRLGAGATSFSLNGFGASFKWFHVVTGTPRPYTVTTPSSVLALGHKLFATTRTFAIAGAIADLRYFHMNTGGTSYTFNGVTALTLKGFAVPVVNGSYSFTGTGAVSSTRSYDLTANYADGAGLYGAPRTASTLDILYRQWNYLAEGEWFDSYDFNAVRSPSYSILAPTLDMAKGYLLSTSSGSFIETGAGASVTATRKLSAVSRSYAVILDPASLLFGHRMLTSNATYNFLGMSVAFRDAHIIVGNVRLYNLIGNSQVLGKGYILPAANRTISVQPTQGSLLKGYDVFPTKSTFTMSGKNNSWYRTYVATTTRATFSVIGITLKLIYPRTMPVTKGTFTLIGVANRELFGHVVTTSTRTHSLVGSNAITAYGRISSFAKATFNYTGVATLMQHGFRVKADTSQLSIRMGDVSGRYFHLTCGTAVYQANGSVAFFKAGYPLPITRVIFWSTGFVTGLSKGYVLRTGVGSFGVNTKTAGEAYGHALSPVVKAFSVTDSNSSLQRSGSISVGYVQYSLQGAQATMDVGRALPVRVGSIVFHDVTETGLYASRHVTVMKTSFAFNFASVSALATRHMVADDYFVEVTVPAAGYTKTYILACATRSHSVQMRTVTSVYEKKVSPQPGVVTAIGFQAQVRKGYELSAQVQAVEMGRYNATSAHQYILKTKVGFFANQEAISGLQGKYKLLTDTPHFAANASSFGQVCKGYTLQVTTKVLSLNARDADFVYEKEIIPTKTNFAVVARPTTLIRNYVLDTVFGRISPASVNATLGYGRRFNVSSNTYFVSSNIAKLAEGKSLIVATGALNLVGTTCSVIYGKGTRVIPGSFNIVEKPVSYSRSYVMGVDRRWYLIGAGFAPMVETRPMPTTKAVFSVGASSVSLLKNKILIGGRSSFNVVNTFAPGVKTLPIDTVVTTFGLETGTTSLVRGTALNPVTGTLTVTGETSQIGRKLVTTPDVGQGLQSKEDTWLTDPVADSIYKDVGSVSRKDLTAHETNQVEETVASKTVDISAAIKRALAIASTPEPTGEATTPETSVDVKNKPGKMIDAKIREYR